VEKKPAGFNGKIIYGSEFFIAVPAVFSETFSWIVGDLNKYKEKSEKTVKQRVP